MHIIGANGHAKVIIDIFIENGVAITGLWDDNRGITVLGDHLVSGAVADFACLKASDFIIAIGNNATRKKVAALLPETGALGLHPTAYISRSATLDTGTVVMANASINAGAKIGRHVIVNTNASVDHDCILGDFVHISPQAGLAGNVQIGEGTHIGIGACVIQGIKIGKWATIGAGAVIIRDVPDYAVVVGNPGRGR